MSKPPKIIFHKPEPLQDYYRDKKGNLYSVARIIDDTKHLKPFNCPIAAIPLGDDIWAGATIYELAFHVRKVMDADLSKPIILDWEGNIADGRHRVIKAIVEGKRTIKAVRMTWKIEPCREADND